MKKLRYLKTVSGGTESLGTFTSSHRIKSTYSGGIACYLHVTTAVGARYGLYSLISATNATGTVWGLYGDVSWTPASSGYPGLTGVQGRVTVNGNFTGGTNYVYAVSGQLHFNNNTVLNNSTSVFSALNGVITADATPTFTAGAVYLCYLDSLSNYNLQAGGACYFLRMANNGTGSWDAAISIYGPRVNSFVEFNSCVETNACLTVLAADVASDNTSHKLQIKIDGSTYYLAVWSSGAWS